MLTPEQKAILQRHVTLTGDGNVVGNDNTARVTKQTAGDYAIQIGEQTITVTVEELRRVLTVELSQVGVIGDNARVEGGIHFHPAPPPTNPTERRNRARMLQLGKNYIPDAVERPWDLEIHLPGQERRPVPHDTPILNLFDQCSGTLLILGQPDSGKTFTLAAMTAVKVRRTFEVRRTSTANGRDNA